jgi:hypothetical protein
MKNLKEIINEYNHDVEFPFLGNTLTISKERNIYNQIRMKYNEIAHRSSVDFAERLNKYDSPGLLYKGLPEDFLYAMKEGLEEVAKDAVSVDCYTLDVDAITKLCVEKKYFDIFDKAMLEYKEKLREILENYNNAEAEIKNNAQNHPYLQTATIGGSLVDVAANQMKADMVNAVIGGIYESSAASKVSDLDAKTEKVIRDFLNNPTYKNKLINAQWECSLRLQLVIYNDLNKECKLGLGDWLTDKDITKAESMYNNMVNMQLPEEKEKEIALSILKLNPMKNEYYETLLAKYIDNAKEILDIAKFFYIDLSGSVKTVMKGFASNNLGKSFEGVKDCRELVKSKIIQLGFPSDSDEEAEKVLQMRSAILLRSYMIQNMGETREEALACFDKAREIAADIGFGDENYDKAYQPFTERMEVLDAALVEELNGWIDDNIGTTEDEAHNLRNELDKRIDAESLDKEKVTCLYKKIDDRLVKLDEEYRTIEGFIFPTRESADESKAIINENKDTLYKSVSEFIYRSDYIAHIDKIKNIPLIEKLLIYFIGVYEKSLKEFDKKCKNAKLYDDKIKGQKKGLKGLARSMFVSDEKQQQDWNEVTHNGQYPLNAIMGITAEEAGGTTGGGFKGLFGKK